MTRWLALVLALQLAGCTIVFPTFGGITAASENRAAREKHQPETASPTKRILLGLFLGLLIDSLILNAALGED